MIDEATGVAAVATIDYQEANTVLYTFPYVRNYDYSFKTKIKITDPSTGN